MRYFNHFRYWRTFKRFQFFRKCRGAGHTSQLKGLGRLPRDRFRTNVFKKVKNVRLLFPLSVKAIKKFNVAFQKLKSYRRYIRRRYKKKILSQFKYTKRNKIFSVRSLVRELAIRYRYFIRKGEFSYYLQRYLNHVSNIEAVLSQDYALNSAEKLVGLRVMLENSIAGLPVNNYREMFYYLTLRKKKNNFYLTLLDTLGGVVLHFSSGRFLLHSGDGKRNKKSRSSFRHMIDFVKKFATFLLKKQIYSLICKHYE